MRIMRPPGPELDGLVEMVQWIPKCKIMVEMGSYSGESTRVFLNSGKVDKIYCVDFWTGIDHQEAEQAFDKFMETRATTECLLDMVGVTQRLFKIKAESEAGSKLFPDKSLDLVYIDATHTYDCIKRDLELWTPKVKPGGYMAGHDYYGEFPGVIKAVWEKFHKPDHVFCDSSWIVKVR